VNVFVTGATGFVGRQLCARLTALGHQVTGVGRGDCDLTVAGALEARPHPSYQHIYHLAAWTHRTGPTQARSETRMHFGPDSVDCFPPASLII